MRYIMTSLTAFLILAAPAQVEGAYTVKREKSALPKELAAGFAKLLDDQALVVQTEQGSTVATIWLCKTLPSKAAPEQVKTGLTYRELQQSTLVGVVQFPQAWTDYRNQRIGAGAYTMRYALQPEDGDHQGTAPYSEFCLLTPIAKDEKPGVLDVKELHELSSHAPGGTHPGVMLLFPNPKPANDPKIESKPDAIQVLFIKMTVEAGSQKAPLGFGFVVAGHAKE